MSDRRQVHDRMFPLCSLAGSSGLITDGDWVESKDQDPEGEVRLLQLADIGVGRFLDKSNRSLTIETANRLRCTTLKPDDILIARMPDPIGRACIFPGSERPCVTVVDVCILRCDRQLADPLYVSHMINGESVQRSIDRFIKGATRQRISGKNLGQIRIPLPPLEEQRRIAAILDAADNLRAKRRAALAKLDQLAQSIFIDMFGDPNTISSSTPSVPLGEIAKFVGGGTPSRAITSYFDGDVCWATAKDMKGDLLWDTEEHVTNKAIDESATNLVDPGTILIVVKSKILLRRLPVAIAMVPVCFGQDLKGIKLFPGWPARYIASHLKLGQHRLLSRARGANTEGLTLDHLRSFKILSSTRNQRDLFERIDVKIEKQRELMRFSMTKLDSIFSSLQHRAFRGEL